MQSHDPQLSSIIRSREQHARPSTPPPAPSDTLRGSRNLSTSKHIAWRTQNLAERVRGGVGIAHRLVAETNVDRISQHVDPAVAEDCTHGQMERDRSQHIHSRRTVEQDITSASTGKQGTYTKGWSRGTGPPGRGAPSSTRARRGRTGARTAPWSAARWPPSKEPAPGPRAMSGNALLSCAARSRTAV